MKGYSASEVSTLLGVPLARLRAWVRSGFLDPDRGPRGELCFSFQDLVLLRTAKGLVEAEIAPSRVRRALAQLKRQLPTGRPLTAVSIGAEGNRLVARDGSVRWNPENGQALFDFDVVDLARKVAPIVRREARAARRAESDQSAEDWFQLGLELELCEPDEARDAYRRAVELDPAHSGAHVNLGRLLHEASQLAAAEAHYRLALAARWDDRTAAFNLGVVLEDQEKLEEALAAYQRSLEIDARFADGHFNLARVFERLGRQTAAIRHYSEYRKLTGRR